MGQVKCDLCDEDATSGLWGEDGWFDVCTYHFVKLLREDWGLDELS